MLEDALEPLGLALRVEESDLIVDRQHAEQLRVRKHDVSDLLVGRSPEWLLEAVQKTVAPTSWQVEGGQGTCQLTGGVLVVNNVPSVHRELLFLCERLRKQQGLPEFTRAIEVMQSRLPGADERERLIRTSGVEDELLIDFVRRWERESGMRLLTNWQALRREGLSSQSLITSPNGDFHLGELFEGLLQVGLVAQFVGENTIQITTIEDSLTRPSVELHAVTAAPSPDVTRIQVELSRGPDDLERFSSGEWAIVLDQTANVLIARLPNAFQAKLARLR